MPLHYWAGGGGGWHLGFIKTLGEGGMCLPNYWVPILWRCAAGNASSVIEVK